jgi:hypothetical protein
MLSVSGDDDDVNETPRRFRTLRPNPLRDIYPWVVVATGIILAVRGGADFSHGDSPENLFIGIGLAALGIIVFCINRWQARRGL